LLVSAKANGVNDIPSAPFARSGIYQAEAVQGDRLQSLYVLAVHTGLRQGELLGLKWGDVDLEAGTLHVRRTLTTSKDGPLLTTPKTKGSRRTVKLSQTALEALRNHLERQLREIGG